MSLAAMTPVDAARVAHACEDHAGRWFEHPMVGGSVDSVCRYLSEGHLSALCDRYTLAVVWAAVGEHLAAYPEILAAGGLTDGRQSARDAAARRLLDEAEVPFRAGCWDEGLALVDRAELESPGFVNFDRYRQIIAERRVT